MMKAFVITVSDRCSRGECEDKSGPVLCSALQHNGYDSDSLLIPDDRDTISSAIEKAADSGLYSLVLTTGGTGLGPRDVTPEATLPLLEKQLPGIAEAIRAESMRITKNAMLSRGVAGVRNNTVIVNLPGSPKGASESLDVFIDCIAHAVSLMHGVKADG